MKATTPICFGVALALIVSTQAASWLDKLGLGPKAPGDDSPRLTTALTGDEMSGGLKEALSKGIQQAVASLGKEDGFLKDAAVKIPVPDSLRVAEKTLRTLHQDQLADEFVTSMNRAAEQAVPEAAAVLGDAVKQMTLADAKAILVGTNNAATAYFRRTSETNLFERFLPIVQKTTEQTGVTRAYKQMVSKANFGGFSASSFLNQNSVDLDGYVTHKALDGLFLKIAQEESVFARTRPPAPPICCKRSLARSGQRGRHLRASNRQERVPTNFLVGQRPEARYLRTAAIGLTGRLPPLIMAGRETTTATLAISGKTKPA